jgi:AcrR family transcriptional regulator
MGKLIGKDQLIDQAIIFFRAKGYSATSIDEIVRACGITKGSLYYHFRSKEDLALAAMDRVHNYFVDHIFRLITEAERPNVTELAAFNHGVEIFFSTHPDGCLLSNLSLEVGVSREMFKERISKFFVDWRECYVRAFALRYPPELAATLAEDAVAIVHGCILMLRINGKIEPLRRQHQHLLALIR